MKESTRKIQEYVKARGSIDRDELIEIARENEEIPSYETLTNQYLGRVVNNAVAQIRDENGNRDVLSPRHGRLSNLKKCKDIHEITSIEKTLARKRTGLDQTLNKVHIVKTSVQLSMFDYENKLNLVQKRKLSK